MIFKVVLKMKVFAKYGVIKQLKNAMNVLQDIIPKRFFVITTNASVRVVKGLNFRIALLLVLVIVKLALIQIHALNVKMAIILLEENVLILAKITA